MGQNCDKSVGFDTLGQNQNGIIYASRALLAVNYSEDSLCNSHTTNVPVSLKKVHRKTIGPRSLSQKHLEQRLSHLLLLLIWCHENLVHWPCNLHRYVFEDIRNSLHTLQII